MAELARMVLFPGLGADARLYRAQREAMPWIETPDWLEPRGGESLRAYAGRWADELRLDERAVLGGVSMGGMVALEMARHAGARAVVLIGSARHPRCTSGLLRMSERASRLAPEWLLDKGRVLAPLFVGRGGQIPAADRDLLVRMAREAPIGFIRWAARAIIEWEGCADPGVPVHHIHGDRDWAIPARGVRPDRVVRGGSHVLNMSHPGEVNEFIAGSRNGFNTEGRGEPRNELE